jgi:hypothetical protein
MEQKIREIATVIRDKAQPLLMVTGTEYELRRVISLLDDDGYINDNSAAGWTPSMTSILVFDDPNDPENKGYLVV